MDLLNQKMDIKYDTRGYFLVDESVTMPYIGWRVLPHVVGPPVSRENHLTKADIRILLKDLIIKQNINLEESIQEYYESEEL